MMEKQRVGALSKRCGRTGQSMVVLVLVIAVFIILPIGLFSYEINRLESCRLQLRAACESAALAAAATLASQDNIDPVQGHTEAVQTALTTFQQNAVIGVSLSNAILSSSGTDSPAAEHSSLFVEFLDPNNNNQPVDLGDPDGKIVRITANFGLKPSFGQMLGIGTLPVHVTNSGGVPDLDVVLCFDVSGSIDDQTRVTFVKREWTGDAATGRTRYTVTNTRSGSKAGASAQGRLYDIIGPVPSGTRVNAIYPQYLALADDSVRWPLTFSESTSTAESKGLRGSTNAGSRPGNCPPGTARTGTSTTFTDMVVNIDGKSAFAGLTTPDGYAFPNIGTVVEAARGNLENDTVFTNSGAKKSLPGTVTARVGYQARYQTLAAQLLSPIGEAQRAARDFFTIMNTNTKGHFAVVAFSDNAGISATSSYSAANVDSTYTAAGNGNFLIPNISLSKTNTNFTEVTAALPNTRATTATNIGDALNTAVTQLRNNSRTGAKKAIVLFTDGMPTQGGPLSTDPETNARKAASAAKTAGIPIYSIGLAQNPEIIPDETRTLTHENSNPSTGGVSGIAGNGGLFFLVTNTDDLRKTFENIARQLVQLVR